MNEPGGGSESELERRDIADTVQRREELISVEATAWTGPLPSPRDFQRYEEILPGAANRILELAERQQAHNHRQEEMVLENERIVVETARAVVASNSNRSKWGLVFAFIVAMAGIGIGGWLTYLGKGGYGLTFVFAPLVSLVGVFIYQSSVRRNEGQRGDGAANQ